MLHFPMPLEVDQNRQTPWKGFQLSQTVSISLCTCLSRCSRIVGFAVVSVALQLSEVCVKLYLFWESIEEAPQEIAAIKEDLQYLISVFSRIESTEEPLGLCIAEGIRHCRTKVAV
jgi:hypothetical protein